MAIIRCLLWWLICSAKPLARFLDNFWFNLPFLFGQLATLPIGSHSSFSAHRGTSARLKEVLCKLFNFPGVFSTFGALVESLVSLRLQNKRNFTDLKPMQVSQSTIIPQQIPVVFGGCKTHPCHGAKNLRGWNKKRFKVSSSHSVTPWKAARKNPAPVNLNCDLWAWLSCLVLFSLTCAPWCFVEKFNQNPRFLSFVPKFQAKFLKDFQE